MKFRASQSGFLLIEVLIVILILSVAFVSFAGVIAQAFRVSSKSKEITEAMTQYESLFFDLESGLRPDLVSFGGSGELEDGYQYEIRAEQEKNLPPQLKSRLSWKSGRQFLEFELSVPEAPVQ